VEQQQFSIKQRTCRAAEEITNTIQLNGRIQWFDQEWSDANELRNTLRNTMLQRKNRASIRNRKLLRETRNKYVGEKRGGFKITYYKNWKKHLDEIKLEIF